MYKFLLVTFLVFNGIAAGADEKEVAASTDEDTARCLLCRQYMEKNILSIHSAYCEQKTNIQAAVGLDLITELEGREKLLELGKAYSKQLRDHVGAKLKNKK